MEAVFPKIIPEQKFFRIEVMDETNPYMWACNGILVTLTYVLTGDHCLWAENPKYWAINKQGESYKYMQFVSKFTSC